MQIIKTTIPKIVKERAFYSTQLVLAKIQIWLMKSRWVQKRLIKFEKVQKIWRPKKPLDGQKNKKGLQRNLTTKMRLKTKKNQGLHSSPQFGKGLRAPCALGRQ